MVRGFSVPVAPMPTNTRALVTVRFIESGTVNGLEVTRFCDLPFANDYWYLIKGRTENILESAARAGETGNFRVVGFDAAGLNSSGDFHGSGSTGSYPIHDELSIGSRESP